MYFFFFVKREKCFYAPPSTRTPRPPTQPVRAGAGFGGVWDSAPRHAATVAILTKKPACLTRPYEGRVADLGKLHYYTTPPWLAR